MNRIQNRPPIIDIEASGFGCYSYPIEVGIVLPDGERFSRLIKPYGDWTHWCEQAESIHGISREKLFRNGTCGRIVAQQLNDFAAGATVYSDCWVVDKPWLETLFYRSGVHMEFHISPLEAILKEVQMEHWRNSIELTRKKLNVQRHRASSDALVIQQTYVDTLKYVGL